jgi:hypothetical protein
MVEIWQLKKKSSEILRILVHFFQKNRLHCCCCPFFFSKNDESSPHDKTLIGTYEMWAWGKCFSPFPRKGQKGMSLMTMLFPFSPSFPY